MNGVEIKLLLQRMHPVDISRGQRYWPEYIEYDGRETYGDKIYQIYNVESESSYDKYKVRIELTDGKITNGTCTCIRYEEAHSCKHLAAVLIRKSDEIVRKSLTNEQVTENILTLFYNPSEEKHKLKKEIKLSISLSFKDARDGAMLIPELKIGTDKMYSFNNKVKKFYNVYDDIEKELVFGKGFTYSKDTCYFNEEDEKIIDFLKTIKLENERSYYYSHYPLVMDGPNIDKFFNLIKDRPFNIEGVGTFTKVIKENPYETYLTKKEDKYNFTLKETPDTKILCSEYAVKDGEFYQIPKEIAKLKKEMKFHGLEELTFKDKNLEKFSKGILREVKDTIELDDTVKDKVIIVRKPSVKLYFDFEYDSIVCKLNLIYKDKEINYFDNTPNILRDTDYENDVINDLTNSHFEIENKKIYISDIEIIGEFLEDHLPKLTEKYDVFTSQKLKETKIKKDIKVRSSFGIGQDNIMSYKFDLEGVSNDEIVNILNEVKKKKKYYRLKSGDLINLEENDNLNELNNLVNSMDLDDKDIRNGGGIIPKYKAIYLDSLKSKYSIIETNNLFNELITKFNSFKDEKLKLSQKDKQVLRDYQVTGVKWLYNIYKCGFGGILADEMGLGKSIQLIYFIKEVLKENSDAKILIIAPTSLIYNWKNEFDKFGSELKYKVCAETKNKREELLNHIDDTNIIITTYGLIREDKDIYQKINFEVIAIDEAQNIKNNTAQMTKVIKSLNGNTKFALTGTPLENSVLELWSIFDFIMPGYLTSIINFQKKYAIKEVDDESVKSLDNLKKQIRPFILRRKKKDVVTELPDKIENNIYLELTKEQKKIYVAELEKTQKELDELIGEEGFAKARFKILQLLTKLRQICIDPSIIYENYQGGSAKLEQLVPLIKEIISNGHKILLFSSYKTAIDIVNRELTNNDISCYVIDGSVSAKKRMELVDNFNNDNTNVFLITLKAGGTGLNLTSADVVIHLDLWWNPQAENQATDRAHRIGQRNTVEVIKLVCKGTIEERILELQNKKKILSDTLIEGEDRDQNIISKLSEKDIKRLLSMDNEE